MARHAGQWHGGAALHRGCQSEGEVPGLGSHRSKHLAESVVSLVTYGTATVFRNNNYITVDPESVEIGELIQVKAGEKIPLDGILISKNASLNTAALTGESKPQSILKGEPLMAGSINLAGLIEAKVTKLFDDSSISRILELVQNATSRKAKTELLIRRLAKMQSAKPMT